MSYSKLIDAIAEKKSCLCVGLDLDLDKIPAHVNRSRKGLFEYLTNIIDATKPYAVAYKINTAFYEVLGVEGWALMNDVFDYLGDDVFKIADAKRGDIGNTAAKYAATFFEQINADAVTIHPYMGHDSVSPFLEYKDKVSILLACTSNPSADDFEKLNVEGVPLYQKIVDISSKWADESQIMYVVGATQIDELKAVRSIAPNHFFLVPGVGAQGGKASDVMKAAGNDQGGVIINASRSIMYASQDENYAEASAKAAKDLKEQMEAFL